MKPKIFVDSIESLENVYHELIPISRHMGIKVCNYTGSELTLVAPLANNINHQLSAFGGSLFSIAALAGWGMMQLKLCEENLDANTVVASGDVSFSLPVSEELYCICSLPDDWQFFLQKLHDRGKGSVGMISTITASEKTAMQFKGRYVVSLLNL
ncbi:MAG: YiiD C-terminal domain-containing protein [Gammaproteobacteria bacterium]|nr:YiiD C-terminal domain-containing protein [Gammaproteobacteria bacterium]